eukprot:5702252-Pyramimonas_sp.AAC.1
MLRGTADAPRSREGDGRGAHCKSVVCVDCLTAGATHYLISRGPSAVIDASGVLVADVAVISSTC